MHVSVPQRGFKPICAHRLHHTSPILPVASAHFIYIVMESSETVFFSTVDIKCSGPVILHVNTFSGCYKSATKAIRQYRACVMEPMCTYWLKTPPWYLHMHCVCASPHPGLVSQLFMPSLYSLFLIRRILNLLVSSLFG